MKIMIVRAALLAMGASSAMAGAPTVDFYGVTVGQPLPFPECETRQQGLRAYYEPGVRQISPCFRNDLKPGAQMPNGNVTVHWPFCEGPAHASDDKLHVKVEDGHVLRIVMFTDGAAAQSAVLADLQSKFGRPTQQDRQSVRDAFGTKYTGITAIWSSRDTFVRFTGIGKQIDAGSVHVYTRVGWESERADDRRQDAKRPPM